MAQTWLDEYVAFAAKAWDHMTAWGKRELGLVVHGEDPDPTDFVKAVNFVLVTIQSPDTIARLKVDEDTKVRYMVFQRWMVSNNLKPQEYIPQLENFANKVIGLLLPNNFSGDGRPLPVCLQVAPDLAADFQSARAPKGVDLVEMIQPWQTIYIDFPPGSFRWEHELELRTIMVAADLPAESWLRDYWMKDAPIIDPTFPKLNIMAVFHDRQRPGLKLGQVVHFGFATGEPGSAYGLLAYEEPFNPARWGDKPAEKLPPEKLTPLMEAIEDIAKLAMLYHKASNCKHVPVPHCSPEHLAAIRPHKRAAKQKTHSLFTITRLVSPPDRFGRTVAAGEATGGWKLESRVRVREHFKWQPHGPGRTLRKLIFVESFERGPKGAPLKLPLHQLR